jgi:hypothetical protein
MRKSITDAGTGSGPADRFEGPYDRTAGPVHGWFGLTYANFLVIHRAMLQSMPLEWQRRLVDLLEDLYAAYADLKIPDFEVTTVEDCYVGELSESQMEILGISKGYGDEEDAYEEDTYTDRTGRELTAHHHVGVPVPDPIPHYKRAYLPPDEAAIAARHAEDGRRPSSTAAGSRGSAPTA